jgi:uncharacterized phiE125 gp8 family phage protein
MSKSLNLTVTSPAQSLDLALTVGEVEHFLGLVSLSPDDDERTGLLEGLIDSAREMAEAFQNKDLVLKQWDLRLPYFPCWNISLRAPLVSVDLVTYKDSDGTTTTLTENTDYIVDTMPTPGIICPPYGGTWPSFTPWPSSAVLVRFTSGNADPDTVASMVRTGMKMLIADWYQERLPLEIDKDGVPRRIRAMLSCGANERA